MAEGVGSYIEEALRSVRAQERVRGVIAPMKAVSEAIDDLEDLAPELEPELEAARARLVEAIGHLSAASDVLATKLDLLTE